MIKEASIKAEFKTDIDSVWKVITNREDISWRPDIEKIDFVTETEFNETTKAGLVTKYVIIKNEKNSIYKIEMKNRDINGVFEAKFEENTEGGCVVNIYQKNEMLSLSAKIASSVFVNLEKLQNRYVYDIKRKLKEI